MPLSADTLIHFTEQKTALKGILENYYKVFYCLETIKLNSNPNSFFVPMVSFCDIPLSQVKDHISKYGPYGLGMTKEWGEKNRLNPVLYVTETSNLSESLRVALPFFIRRAIKENIDANESKSLLDVLRHIKNYEGELKRKNGDITPDYRFSDEREWRYVPSFEEDLLMLIPLKNSDQKLADNQLKLDSFRLKFEPNDIKYIIIKDESEISEFIDHLKSANNLHLNSGDLERLTTRIITAEQINRDM